MKKRIVRWIVFCIMFFVMVLCMGRRKEAGRFYHGKESCQVIDGIDGITYQDVETMKENQEFVAGCYSTYPAQSITGDGHRSAKVTVIAVDGDSDLLFHSFNILYQGDYAQNVIGRLEHMFFENKEVPEQLCLKNGLKCTGYLLIVVIALIYMIVRTVKVLGNYGFNIMRIKKTFKDIQEQSKQIKEEKVYGKSLKD